MAISPRTLKDGTTVYEIRVSRGRDPVTGKQLTPYSRRYTPPEGYSAKRALKEAQVIAAQFEADCRAGKVLTKAEEKAQRIAQAEAAERERLEAAARPTFREYSEAWLKQEAVSQERSKQTIQNYRYILECAGQSLGDYKMVDINKAIMQTYVSELFTSGCNKSTGEPLSYSTKALFFKVLRSFFELAVDADIIPASPMAGVKKPKRPKGECGDTDREKAFTAEQARYLLECVEKAKPMYKALVTFMLDTGCRNGEAVGMKWEDIDFRTGTVTISRNALFSREEGTYIDTPKSGKARTVCLTPQALAVMREWKHNQALSLLKRGLPQAEFCFTNAQGLMIHPDTPRRYFKSFGNKYGIPDFHPHKLRHTMANLAISNGADYVSVSKKLGHSTPSITLNVYCHANEEAQRRANEILADAIYKQA